MATVLVVDDERPILTLLKRMLGKEHNVIAAESGIEALAIYASYFDQIDLVITDITMPGMSGLELVARLETLCSRRLPVIFMTGFSELPLEPGGTVVSKPFSPAAMSDAIKRVIPTSADLRQSPKTGQS
jgi:CheY-like chemotaxis protein